MAVDISVPWLWVSLAWFLAERYYVTFGTIFNDLE